MTTRERGSGELVIGVVGPHELVERVMLSTAAADSHVPGESGPAPAALGGAGSTAPRRLVAVACRHDHEAADKVARLDGRIDACLFANPMAYRYALDAGSIAVPCTYVPVGGSALLAALVQARHYDLERISLDVLTHEDVVEAYTELGISPGQVRLCADAKDATAAAAFHERLWQQRTTSAALTCMQPVAQRLSRSGVPVVTVRPTNDAIRTALRTATLLAGHRRLRESGLTLVLVEVPGLREGHRRALSRHGRDEVRLSVHRFLAQQARRTDALVTQLDDHSFALCLTTGSLAAAGTQAAQAPGSHAAPALPLSDIRDRVFLPRARTELGIPIEVGVGTGATMAEAEARARRDLRRARASSVTRGTDAKAPSHGAVLVPYPGNAASAAHGHVLPSRHGPVPSPRQPLDQPAAAHLKGIQILSKLSEGMRETPPPLVVDAEVAGRALGVTARTARRLLRTLVDEGLAWPLPLGRTVQPGRPRQFYRLITERLGYPETARS